MGFNKQAAAEALRQANNNMSDALEVSLKLIHTGMKEKTHTYWDGRENSYILG